jgi:hypothetical protein
MKKKPNWLLWGGVALGAYLLLRKKEPTPLEKIALQAEQNWREGKLAQGRPPRFQLTDEGGCYDVVDEQDVELDLCEAMFTADPNDQFFFPSKS